MCFKPLNCLTPDCLYIKWFWSWVNKWEIGRNIFHVTSRTIFKYISPSKRMIRTQFCHYNLRFQLHGPPTPPWMYLFLSSFSSEWWSLEILLSNAFLEIFFFLIAGPKLCLSSILIMRIIFFQCRKSEENTLALCILNDNYSQSFVSVLMALEIFFFNIRSL